MKGVLCLLQVSHVIKVENVKRWIQLQCVLIDSNLSSLSWSVCPGLLPNTWFCGLLSLGSHQTQRPFPSTISQTPTTVNGLIRIILYSLILYHSSNSTGFNSIQIGFNSYIGPLLLSSCYGMITNMTEQRTQNTRICSPIQMRRPK